MTYLNYKNRLSESFLGQNTMHIPNLYLKNSKFLEIITFSKIQFMQRFTQNLLPCSFNDTWVKNAIRNIGENEIQLRNRFQLQNFYSNLARLDSFPLYSFPKIWESFPSEQIKIIRKISDFDAKLKTFFINDLSSVAVCNRLLCPACMAVQGLWVFC